jgi:L-iditol 2-dehydrogenase
MNTRVVCVEEPNRISLRNERLSIGENEILVKAYMSSICGTDKNYYLGHTPKPHAVKDTSQIENESHSTYPMLIGHEGAGEVVETGAAVRKYKPGDKVISFGWKNTMADYWVSGIRHDGYGVTAVPDGMDMTTASLGEPIACAVYAGMVSGVELGDTVAVIGAGFAGQIIAQTVKAKGARKVIVVDVVDGKLELAKRIGADAVINAKTQNVLDIILDETKGYGVDVVIEAAGYGETIETGTEILKHGGILGLYSWVLDPVRMGIDRWHNDGFDIRTLALMHRVGHDRPWWIAKTLDVVNHGIIHIKPLISHTYDLCDAATAFHTACYDENACKVMLRP